MAHFLQIKIVSDKLNEVRRIVDEYVKDGYELDGGVIQVDDNGINWAFVNKDFGLIKKQYHISKQF